MNIEVLLSTMNTNDYEIVNNIKIKSNCTIINQCNKNSYNSYNIEDKVIKFICSDSRGLSKSRNLALINATGDICLLADDDLEYVDEYERIISEAFEENPTYDIITFNVEGKNKKFKEYSKQEKKLNYITSLKVSSVEIAFKLKSVREKNIKFNELLGTGSKYCMGEENVFLYDALRNGLNIKYIPIKIADLYIGNSSWFKGFNEKYFYDRGAVFTAMSKKYSLILIVQFAIRHYFDYKKEISIFKAIKLMIKGRKSFLGENI